MKQVNSTLYAVNSDGSFQQWKVKVADNKIYVEFGKLNGKIQIKETTCEGKNIGRANETTPQEQALFEANSKWEKQFRLGYRESLEDLESNEVLLPMLAHDAIKRSHNIIFPCYVQAKLDGLRCLITFDKAGNPIFTSRGNKTFPVQGKIVDQLKRLREKSGKDIFDGELYIHGLPLQKIVSLVKKWKTPEYITEEILKDHEKAVKKWNKNPQGNPPVPDTWRYMLKSSEDVEFHIFDVPSDKTWDINGAAEGSVDYSLPENSCRYADLIDLEHFVHEEDLSHIKIVEGNYFFDISSLKVAIGLYMQQGYEGIIIRNLKGLYLYGQRSQDLQKWKIFQTVEAKVVGVTLDKNGEGVLNCVLQNDVEVSVKMKGNHEYRKYENMLNLVESFITISLQSYTQDGVPQFPVGISERNVDPVTWEVLE